MTTLFPVDERLLQIADVIDECDGDLDRLGSAKEGFIQYMDSTALEQSQKIDNIILWKCRLEMEIAAAKAQEEQFAKARRSRENTVDWIKEMTKRHLELHGLEKFTTETGRKVWLQTNGNVSAQVNDDKFNEISDEEMESLVGAGVIVMQPMLSKANLKDYLLAGNTCSFAVMPEKGKHIRMK